MTLEMPLKASVVYCWYNIMQCFESWYQGRGKKNQPLGEGRTLLNSCCLWRIAVDRIMFGFLFFNCVQKYSDMGRLVATELFIHRTWNFTHSSYPAIILFAFEYRACVTYGYCYWPSISIGYLHRLSWIWAHGTK